MNTSNDLSRIASTNITAKDGNLEEKRTTKVQILACRRSFV